MTIAERFTRYVAVRIRIDAVRRQLKDLENEAKPEEAFVKDWFRARPERRRYLGVNYAATARRRLDVTKARLMLGAKAAQAEVETLVETLALDADSKAVRQAAGLKPVRDGSKAS